MMATGYVHQMIENKEPFERWIWTCARAFGALILMRDDPMDAPIPQKFEPGDFYAKHLLELKDELANLQSLNADEALALGKKKCAEKVAMYERLQAEDDELRGACEKMAAFVMQWKPPTSEHEGLKKFMLEQLNTSCRGGERDYWKGEIEAAKAQDWVGWVARRIAELQLAIPRAEKDNAEELARTASRNEWIEQLRQSVANFKGEWREDDAEVPEVHDAVLDEVGRGMR